MPLSFWQRWQADRALQQRAARYTHALGREPADADVEWLAEHGTGGDADHARWELRYARRALGLVAAARDALDDRTASAVARALSAALARDPYVAAGMLPVAERQFNARLRGYGDAYATRAGGQPLRARLGAALLGFAAGEEGAADDAAAERAGDILTRFLAEANDALRGEFGAATLPDDLPPSAVGRA